jgi:hypothetical protein
MAIARRMFGVVLVACSIGLAAAQTPATTPQAPAGPPQPAQSGVVSAGKGNPYNFARGVPARIVDFQAEPASILPGQAATLTWSTEDPSGITIDPGLGRVAARGVVKVTPSRTTAYTLTVLGPNDQKLTRTVTVNVAGTTPLTGDAASEATKKATPRTADGKPDLSGVWAGGGVGAGRAANAAEAPVLKPGAEKFKVVRGPDDTGQYSDCMPLAGPQGVAAPYHSEFVQSAHALAILNGFPGTFRIIPTDGGPHPVDPDPTWMGDSIGHWEGDTLVVDSVGYNDKTEISGYRHTDALHIVERFRRPDFNTIQYEATMEDPNVFAKPWTLSRVFQLRTDMTKADEFVCENNRDYNKLFDKK